MMHGVYRSDLVILSSRRLLRHRWYAAARPSGPARLMFWIIRRG